MRILLPFSVCLLFFTQFSFSQSGCPGCTVFLPPLNSDTFYLTEVPDGQVGVYYDADLSFRLPMTTNGVPGAPPGLTISQITISSISDLPTGLNWQANQTVFNPSVQTDGCVKMCGVPLESDSFFITVHIVAEVFGIAQNESYIIPMYVGPSVSNTDGFSISNSTGCGFAEVSFANNVPSNGDPGYTYAWDFGNGNQSDLENPPFQTYNGAGTYYVNYYALVDTAGYYLAGISVESSNCNDDIPPFLTGPPDLYLKIYDPAGDLILTTATIENAAYPASFSINQYIDTGNYTVQVWDDDTFLGGDDDDCGSYIFTQNDDGLVQNGNLFLAINSVHPVQEVSSLDSVIIYEIPANPILNEPVETALCQGDSVFLSSNYTAPVSWFKNGVLYEEQEGIWVHEEGDYQAIFVSENGCFSDLSNTVTLTFFDLPVSPAYSNLSNELTLYDPGSLPELFQLQWYFEGELIVDENTEVLCATSNGLYTLEVTDLETGCSNSFSTNVVINPAFDCTLGAEDQAIGSIRIYPNPVRDMITIQGNLTYPINISDVTGRVVFSIASGDNQSQLLNLDTLYPGIYFIEMPDHITRKFIKE